MAESTDVPPIVMANVLRAVRNGKYLIAAFRVKDDGLLLDRVTNDFPKERFDEAIRLLMANLSNAH